LLDIIRSGLDGFQGQIIDVLAGGVDGYQPFLLKLPGD
jgi:hypothetical protein